MLVVLLVSTLLTTVTVRTVNSDRQSSFKTFSRDEFYDVIVGDDGFVDKSMFIEDFIVGAGQVLLITRPPGWGKSVNMRMLKRFLEWEVDEKGDPVPDERKINRKLFAGGELRLGNRTKQLKPLKIAENEQIMKLQGRFAVIYVSFSDIVGFTYREIADKLRKLSAALFDRYRYARANIKELNATTFDLYHSGSADDEQLHRSLFVLSRFLCTRYNRDVYILIDDYDQPLNQLFASLLNKGIADRKAENGSYSDGDVFRAVSVSAEFNQTFALLQRILDECLKTNDVLYKGLLSGVLDVNLARFVGRLDNVLPYWLLDFRFKDLFGFTETEVSALLNRTGSCPKPVSPEDVRLWYSYNFTGGLAYNSRSIKKFLENDCEFQPYLDQQDDKVPFLNSILLSDQMQRAVQTLISGLHLSSNMRNKIRFDLLLDEFGALFFTGYLSPYSSFPDKRSAWGLYAPNAAVLTVLKKKMSEWVCRKLLIAPEDFDEIVNDLTGFEIGQFKDTLQKFLASVSPGTMLDPPLYYHGFMKSVAYALEENYVVNISSVDEKTTNITALAKPDKGDTAIYILYTVSADVNALNADAKTGLEQINKAVLLSELRFIDRIKHTLKVSFAFHRRSVSHQHKYNRNSRF